MENQEFIRCNLHWLKENPMRAIKMGDQTLIGFSNLPDGTTRTFSASEFRLFSKLSKELSF